MKLKKHLPLLLATLLSLALLACSPELLSGLGDILNAEGDGTSGPESLVGKRRSSKKLKRTPVGKKTETNSKIPKASLTQEKKELYTPKSSNSERFDRQEVQERNEPVASAKKTRAIFYANGISNCCSDTNRFCVKGAYLGELKAMDRHVYDYMRENDVPNMSLAVSDNRGRMVLNHSYTNCSAYNKVFDWHQNFTSNHHSLFRLASVSKMIAGVAILHLVENNKGITLNTRIDEIFDLPPARPSAFSPLDFKGIQDALNQNWRHPTLRELLQHEGGWGIPDDPATSTDEEENDNYTKVDKKIAIALKKNLPISAKDIFDFVTPKGYDYPPGSDSVYSNFGYVMADQVIKKVSGLSYEAYAKKHIFQPLGMKRIQKGATLKANRDSNEVPYFRGKSKNSHKSCPDSPDSQVLSVMQGTYLHLPSNEDIIGRNCVYDTYGGRNIGNMLGNGGWSAAAYEMLRFTKNLAQYTVDSGKEKVISAQNIAKIWEPNDNGFGLGWMIRDNDISHGGTISGTKNNLTRFKRDKKSNDLYEVTFVLLSNRDLDEIGDLIGRLKGDNGLKSINDWGDKTDDLFDTVDQPIVMFTAALFLFD